MPQPTTVSDEIRERMIRIRGDVRLYKDLDPTKTALVVIDMQNAFVDESGPIHVPASKDIIEPINSTVAACRELGVPVIWIRSHHPKNGADWRGFFDHFVLPERREAAAGHLSDDSWGSQFYPAMDVQEQDYIVFKNRYSCLIPGSSSLERLLRSQKKDTVLLAGTKTNICVESTARDGMMLDFRMVVLSDATCTLTDREHQAALDVMVQEFADILTTDQVLSELKAAASVNAAD